MQTLYSSLTLEKLVEQANIWQEVKLSEKKEGWLFGDRELFEINLEELVSKLEELEAAIEIEVLIYQEQGKDCYDLSGRKIKKMIVETNSSKNDPSNKFMNSLFN